jgi:putative zinc finger/helix-turn-helix YgiT family protein
MNAYICPNCGKGQVRQTRREYDATIKGINIAVRDALVGVCDNCGVESVTKGEIQRWQQMAEARIQSSNALLTPLQIKHLREGLGYSIPRFARLLGTTRQSVHNWERPDRKAPQLRTIDVLLRLVDKARTTQHVDVLGFLKMQAQDFEAAISGDGSKRTRGRAANYSDGFSFLPRDVYDQNFEFSEIPPDLPLLTVH